MTAAGTKPAAVCVLFCRYRFVLLLILQKAVADIGKRFTDFFMPFRFFVFICCVKSIDDRVAAPAVILKIFHVFLQHPV